MTRTSRSRPLRLRVWPLASALALTVGAGVAPAAEPVRGNTLAMAIHVGEPATYDCHATNSPAVMWRVAPHYSTLLRISGERFPRGGG